MGRATAGCDPAPTDDRLAAMTAFVEPDTGLGSEPLHLDAPADHLALRDSFATFPSGVAVVAARVEGAPVGLLVSSFVTVSLDPPLVSICVDHTSTTWPTLGAVRRLGISVLSERHEATARQFAGAAARRFAGVRVLTGASGAVLVDEAAGWFECSVHAEVPAGDHDVVLLEVHGHRRGETPAPLVFHGSRFRGLSADE
jgi:flavin reductase (DIM6/NTAB) family NADH-FMN oxidoreductase RutF